MNTKTKLALAINLASKIVSSYRARAPVGFDPVNQSFGATDVMNDPRYLTTMLARGPRDPMYHVAIQRLAEMQQQQTQAASIGATRANLEEQIRSREQAHGENVAQREQRAKELEDFHQARLAQEAGATKERELSVLQRLAELPGPGQQQAQAELLRRLNIQPGATAPDATTAAAQRFAGKPVTGAVPTTAGAPLAAGATTTAPTGAQAQAAPTGGAPPDLGPTPPSNWLATAPRTVGPGGAVTTQLPSGGTATAFDRSTPEGVAAINAARQESSRLQGIPFSPVSLVAKAANVPTKETMAPLGPGEGPKLAGATPPAPAPAPVIPPTTAGPTTPPAPTRVELGFGGKPLGGFSVGLSPNVPSNTALDVAAARANPQAPFSPMSNQAQDVRAGGMNFADITRPPPVPNPDEEARKRLAAQPQY